MDMSVFLRNLAGIHLQVTNCGFITLTTMLVSLDTEVPIPALDFLSKMECTKSGKGQHHQALTWNLILINPNGLKPLEPKILLKMSWKALGFIWISKALTGALRRTLREPRLSHPLVCKRSWMLTLQRASWCKKRSTVPTWSHSWCLHLSEGRKQCFPLYL